MDKPMTLEQVRDDKFMCAWINLGEFPGGLMKSGNKLFGPVPALTNCLITTSETDKDRWVSRGDKVMEVWSAAAVEAKAMLEHVLPVPMSVAAKVPDARSEYLGGEYAAGWNACREAMIAQGNSGMRSVDYLGSALELEELSKTVESKTCRRAMEAAAHKLRMAEQGNGGVVAGWKLVPVEPTQEMLNAHSKNFGYVDTRWCEGDIEGAWEAMLSAAPQPDDGGNGNG